MIMLDNVVEVFDLAYHDRDVATSVDLIYRHLVSTALSVVVLGSVALGNACGLVE